jgi:hypothetical protein
MFIVLHVKYTTRYTLMKFQFSRQIFEKYSDFKFHEYPSGGSRFQCGQTDRHDEGKSSFRNFASSQKSCAGHIMNNIYTFHLLMITPCHQLYQYLDVFEINLIRYY